MRQESIVLEAQDICKTFEGAPPISLLKNVSLTVRQATAVAVVGKSGSGKSSLLHILGGLDLPSSGTVKFPRAEGLSLEKIRRLHIGFVFQAFHLLEDYSLLENVMMPGKIAKKDPSCLKKRSLALLEQVDLIPRQNTPVKLLSGGERQRAAIARALCNDPDILFVDEPTGNLDRTNALMIQDLLLSCCKDHGKALVLVTHDEDFARLCDVTYKLSDGVLL